VGLNGVHFAMVLKLESTRKITSKEEEKDHAILPCVKKAKRIPVQAQSSTKKTHHETKAKPKKNTLACSASGHHICGPAAKHGGAWA
jgi:hypothetical protein